MYQLNSLVKNKLFIAKHRKSYLANNQSAFSKNLTIFTLPSSLLKIGHKQVCISINNNFMFFV